MKCAKRDVQVVEPDFEDGIFYLDLAKLRKENVDCAIQSERGVGNFVPYCNSEVGKGKGVIVGGINRCKGWLCPHLVRYTESGVGEDRLFSTFCDVSVVRPHRGRGS